VEKAKSMILNMQMCMCVRVNNTRTSDGANGIVALCTVGVKKIPGNQ
jgi:hypothetical protein